MLDPFCGCATALVAADRLGRKWAGIDLSLLAIKLVKERIVVDPAANPLWAGTIALDTPPKGTDLGNLPNYRTHRHRLYGEQEGVCVGCNTHFPFRVMDVDHVLPRSKGGTDHPDNLQLLCSGCNRSKGGKTMAEGRRLLLGSEATNTPQTCMVDAKIVMPLRSLSNDKHNDKHRLVPGGKITAGNRARQECYRSWEIDATR